MKIMIERRQTVGKDILLEIVRVVRLLLWVQRYAPGLQR